MCRGSPMTPAARCAKGRMGGGDPMGDPQNLHAIESLIKELDAEQSFEPYPATVTPGDDAVPDQSRIRRIVELKKRRRAVLQSVEDETQPSENKTAVDSGAYKTAD